MSSPTVPIFSPDGQLGDVPYEQMHSAIAAGGKLGVNIKAPDGSMGVVPSDNYAAAAKAGGQIVPYDVSSKTPKTGFRNAIVGDLKNMAASTVTLGAAAAGNPYAQQQFTQGIAEQIANAPDEAKARKQAGYSAFYRTVAPIAQAAGINVPGMEQAAREGDELAVLGHAEAPLLAGALAKGASAVVKSIPTKGSAAAKLSTAASKANQVTLDLEGVTKAAMDVKELSDAGSQMPGVVRKFIKRINDTSKPPLDYRVGRKFYSNATRISKNEYSKLTADMHRELGNFTRELGKSNQAAANQAGVGPEHAAGMREYHSAARLNKTVKTVAKYGAEAAGVSYLAHVLGGRK